MQAKQALIGLLIGGIILLGAGGVFLYSRNKPAQPGATETTSQTSNQTSMSNSLSELLSLGKTQKCTFSYSDENGATSGTVYMDRGNMRGDMMITTVSDNKTLEMSMIRRGDDNYIWGGGFPENTGLKMTLSAEELETNEDAKKYIDTSRKVDYDCGDWTPDSTMFNPPSNIKFEDLSAMMQGLVKPSGVDCSVCNSLTGEAKNACLSGLGC